MTFGVTRINVLPARRYAVGSSWCLDFSDLTIMKLRAGLRGDQRALDAIALLENVASPLDTEYENLKLQAEAFNRAFERGSK